VSNQKFIYLAFVLGALSLAVTMKSASVAVMATLGQPDNLVAGLLPISTLIAGGVAVGSFFAVLRNQQAVGFTDLVISELVKVKWPDREETLGSSWVVIAATAFLALSLALFDFFWAKVTGVFLFTEV